MVVSVSFYYYYIFHILVNIIIIIVKIKNYVSEYIAMKRKSGNDVLIY